MTEDEYYAVVKRLGLRPSNILTVYLTSENEAYNVPLANRQTPEQREETISKLRLRLGITMPLKKDE